MYEGKTQRLPPVSGASETRFSGEPFERTASNGTPYISPFLAFLLAISLSVRHQFAFAKYNFAKPVSREQLGKFRPRPSFSSTLLPVPPVAGMLGATRRKLNKSKQRKKKTRTFVSPAQRTFQRGTKSPGFEARLELSLRTRFFFPCLFSWLY